MQVNYHPIARIMLEIECHSAVLSVSIVAKTVRYIGYHGYSLWYTHNNLTHKSKIRNDN